MKNSVHARLVAAGVAAATIFVASSSSVLSQELITQKALSADMALAIAQGALEQCRADGSHVSVTVIDGSGLPKVFIRDDQSGPRVLHVVHPAAELEAGELPGADEVQLGPVGVSSADDVDDRAESGQLVGIDLVPARSEGLHDLAGVDEHRHLVRVDDRTRVATDGDVRPFEDDLTFAVIRYGDEFPPEQCHGRTIPAVEL